LVPLATEAEGDKKALGNKHESTKAPESNEERSGEQISEQEPLQEDGSDHKGLEGSSDAARLSDEEGRGDKHEEQPETPAPHVETNDTEAPIE
jgi:hypothetical protein